jgi:hypothetical protein
MTKLAPLWQSWRLTLSINLIDITNSFISFQINKLIFEIIFLTELAGIAEVRVLILDQAFES